MKNKNKRLIKGLILAFFSFIFLTAIIGLDETGERIIAIVLSAVCGYFAYKTFTNKVKPKYKKNQQVVYTKTKTVDKPIPTPIDYIVLDTETTGFSPTHDDIVEIGAIKVSNGIVIDEYHTYCKPFKSIKNSEFHGVTNEMVENYKYSKDYMPELFAFIGKLPILIYNAQFDTAMLNVQLDNNFKNKVIDVLKIAKTYEIRDDYKLEHIKPTIGIDNRSHNAVNDCHTTNAYFMQLVEKYKIETVPTFKSRNVDKEKNSKKFYFINQFLEYDKIKKIRQNDKIDGKIITITGELDNYTRYEAAKKIIENGGIYSDRLILKADILVVGKLDHETDKIKKANEYNDLKKSNIDIINELQFIEMLEDYNETC